MPLLVFVDDCGVGAQLVEQLEALGQTVITVRAEDYFSQQNDSTYTLNPAQKKDYQALFKALRNGDLQPDRIVHLWNVTEAKPNVRAIPSGRPNTPFYGLLFLAQVLGEQGLSDALQLTVVSNQLPSMTGNESMVSEKVTLLGPGKVIGQEYPHITCRSVDIVLPRLVAQAVSLPSVPPPQSHARQRVVNQLLNELTIDTKDSIVAYRGKHRGVQTYESVELEQVSFFTAPRASPLREQGVYLITNGLSDTGLVMATYLAQRVQAKLVLTDAKQAILSDRMAAKVQAIEGLGAEVLVVKAEVTEPSEMQAALEQATQRFGSLHGVIHIAPRRSGGLMQLKTPEQADDILNPRVTGTQVLRQVLQGRRGEGAMERVGDTAKAREIEDTPLDFIALFGSTVAQTGGLGQVDECAANAFLDAYAHSHDSRPIVTIGHVMSQKRGS